MPTKICRTFNGTGEQLFWPDALPASTSDSYGHQWELDQGSLGASPLPTTEPRLRKRNKDLTKKNQTRNRAIDNQTGLVSMTELCTRVPVYNGQKRGRAHEFLDRVK